MQFIRETGCVPRCKTPTYSLKLRSLASQPREGEKSAQVQIAVNRPEITLVEEYEAYG